MIVGDPTVFAIESGVTRMYERLSFKALGYFIIHVAGHCYGVRSSEASMLARSLDAVERRILARGEHTVPFESDAEGGSVADAVRDALYADGNDDDLFFGITRVRFADLIYSRDIVWAPDGDQAFDDGSYVLQFDVDDRVRVIGFRSIVGGYAHDPSSLGDVWLSATDFYSILDEWRSRFDAEWKAAPKVAIDSEEL